MTIKSDKWIRRMAEKHRMIEPYEPGQVRAANGHCIVSYGTSSYGYDIRSGMRCDGQARPDRPLNIVRRSLTKC